jgi:hypothetical protein
MEVQEMTIFELKRTKKEMFRLKVFFWLFSPIWTVELYLAYYKSHPEEMQNLAILCIASVILAVSANEVINRHLRKINASEDKY